VAPFASPFSYSYWWESEDPAFWGKERPTTYLSRSLLFIVHCRLGVGGCIWVHRSFLWGLVGYIGLGQRCSTKAHNQWLMEIKPISMAMMAAWVRSEAPNLLSICPTWFSTVLVPRNSTRIFRGGVRTQQRDRVFPRPHRHSSIRESRLRRCSTQTLVWLLHGHVVCWPFEAVSGRSHNETWAGCIVSLTTPTSSSFSASRSVSSLSLTEKSARVFLASYLLL
jgi:hypothetical protein